MKVLLLLCLFASLEEGIVFGRYRYNRIACPTIKIKYGRSRLRQKSGFAQYQCNKGYLLAGEKYSKCIGGEWDSPPPKCVRASCQKIKPPLNGLIYPSHRGAVLNFFCKSGYILKGPNTTYCDGWTWDSYLPSCLPSHLTPSLSCDFEAEDICGWSHDLNHNFDWTRLNFKTPSGHIGTGPSFDHTKGDGNDGHYMYIESSSRNVNDTARLISPVYEEQFNNTCLEFYYHMYGTTTGQLRVYVKKTSEPWTSSALQPENAVFWNSGNHGDRWLRSLLNLGAIEEDFQIIFEGVRGNGYVSDIAIDDVKLIENCVMDDLTTTTESDVYTDAISYESCLNRCGNDSNLSLSQTDSFQISCDCDDDCTDRNSCCPDYVAICVLSDFSTEYYTDYYLSATNVTQASIIQGSAKPDTTISAIAKMTPTRTLINTQNITNLVNNVTISLPSPSASSVTKMNAITTTNITKATSNIMKATALSTKKNQIVPNVTIPMYTTQKTAQETKTTISPKEKRATMTARLTSSTLKRRPTPSTTKIESTSSSSTTSKTLVETRGVPPISTDKKRYMTTGKLPLKKTELVNDIATIPDIPDEDISFPIITIATISTTENYDYSLEDSDKNHNINRLASEKAATIKEKPKSGGVSMTVIVVSACLVVLGVLCAIFLVRRYTSNSCIRIKKMKSGSGDSQSDVRYLTSDEFLDFNLATPDGYNTM